MEKRSHPSGHLWPSNALLLALCACATIGIYLLNGKVFRSFDEGASWVTQSYAIRETLLEIRSAEYRARSHAMRFLDSSSPNDLALFSQASQEALDGALKIEKMYEGEEQRITVAKKLYSLIALDFHLQYDFLDRVSNTPSVEHKKLPINEEADVLVASMLAEEEAVLEQRLHLRDGLIETARENAELLTLMAAVMLAFSGFIVRRFQLQAEEDNFALEEARREAEAANEAKSSFLANISHEIRTPMTAIVGYADLLMDPSQSVSERLDCVQTIRRNGDHLLEIINDILDLSKVEAGRLDIELQETSLAAVIADVMSLMRQRAAEKKLELTIENSTAIPVYIRSDSLRVRQILINLLGNAIKFTSKGGVHVDLAVDNKSIYVAIHDSGPGMTKEEISRLFQPFTQADASTARTFGGTGLGLAISRRLARLLGGELLARSVKNGGSTFTLVLPLEGASEQLMDTLDDEPIRSAGIDTSTPIPHLSGRVLVAEDGQDNQHLISYHLRRAGLEVEIAENGSAAVTRAMESIQSGNPFDVILMDMQMPVMDGLTATSLLRARGYTHPIIALSANAMHHDRERCRVAGCEDFVAKPLALNNLFAVIGRYLDERPGETGADQPVSAGLDDQTLEEMKRAFVQSLPDRISSIEDRLKLGELKKAAELIHQLCGACGGYGLPTLSEQAQSLEGTLHKATDAGQVSADIARFKTEALMIVHKATSGSQVGDDTEKDDTSTSSATTESTSEEAPQAPLGCA